MSARLSVIAPAKVNLYLHVTGKRADGYHLLESLVSFTDIHDRVTIEASKGLSLSMAGRFASALATEEDNILLKAARLLAEKAGRNPDLHITLHKELPVGAGIGGGSADAAALMRLLHHYWELPFSDSEMLEIGVKLGADVPVCYHSKSMFFSGIGEKLTPVEMIPALPAILINPLISLSTIEVFKNRQGGFSAEETVLAVPTSQAMFLPWLMQKKNDLEASAVSLLPVIKDILAAFEGFPECRLARMSGSGATCFGVFDTKEQAAITASHLQKNYPHWWVKEATIGS